MVCKHLLVACWAQESQVLFPSISICLSRLELWFEAGSAHWYGNCLQAGNAAGLPALHPCQRHELVHKIPGEQGRKWPLHPWEIRCSQGLILPCQEICRHQLLTFLQRIEHHRNVPN